MVLVYEEELLPLEIKVEFSFSLQSVRKKTRVTDTLITKCWWYNNNSNPMVVFSYCTVKVLTQAEHLQKLLSTHLCSICNIFFLFALLLPLILRGDHCRSAIPPTPPELWGCPRLLGSLHLPCSHHHSAPHIWTLLLRLPKALEPTLVGTKLFLPTAPDLLRKSARRWVTQVAVLQALFCAVTLLFGRKRKS